MLRLGRMTRQEFLVSLDNILELPAGTLTGPEQLDECEQWNSMAMIGFIALADQHNNARLSARQLSGCQTVDELLKLATVEG